NAKPPCETHFIPDGVIATTPGAAVCVVAAALSSALPASSASPNLLFIISLRLSRRNGPWDICDCHLADILLVSSLLSDCNHPLTRVDRANAPRSARPLEGWCLTDEEMKAMTPNW